MLHNLRVTLEMIKWEHSIFALPFALCGAMLAASGLPSVHQLAWIVVAMVAARSAAMAFNRWADASIDAANPRTSTRALPAGRLVAGVRRHIRSGLEPDLRAGRKPVESADSASVARRARRAAAVFVHQAPDSLVASRARICAGHCSFGRVDCGARLARSPDTSSYRRGHVLGRRLRRSLRLPGLRIRPPGRTALDPALLRHRHASLWIARGFHLIMVALLIALIIAFGMGKTGDLRSGCRSPAIALRAYPGEAQ